jgi:choline dehydrogenase-like flavoprotein
MTSESALSDRERAVLAALCVAFHPRLVPREGDLPELFGTSAGELGVPGAAEEAIALLTADQRNDLRRFLRMLDNRFAALAIAGSMRSVTSMTLDDRERLLGSLATSRIGQIRTGFQAIKRLSSFLFYTLSEPDGGSPVWRALDYKSSPRPPSSAVRLDIGRVTSSTILDADVCIVGSGAGGGVVAAALARKGLSVVVLEAGPGQQAGDFEQGELNGMQNLYLEHGLLSSRDLGVAILAGACLGGGTAVNWQTCLRTPGDIRDEWSDTSGVELFSSDRFSQALDQVWSRVGASTDESFVNANNAPIQRGADALGWSWESINRNARGCDATQCGYCPFGCRVGGKQSTPVTYLHDAQQNGDCRILADCWAERVMIESGRVAGVVASGRDVNGRRVSVTVRAPRVVVAGGGIQSPALLLRSGISSPQLGHHLYLHPTTAVAGVYDERVESWSGPAQTIVSNHFANVDGRFGVRIEAAPAHPGLLALAVPWVNAAQHRRLMQQSPYASAIIALTRDSTGGRVTIRRDGSAVIDYVPGAPERARVAKGIAAVARIHFAAGAREVHTLHTRAMSFEANGVNRDQKIEQFCERVLRERVDRNWSLIASAHQMGTCRMGRDYKSAVLDQNGEVFGVKNLFVADASAFPASSGVNPMITVMALAMCVAETIDR